ncbi:uncharacterized protein BXZ73DRAFT_103015 [Epithele typhae]|uniref:uncharacterized protein n=1 Tax=Epithele typhae TaxID=378194 RepID=UPI002007E290|nr:uncharacterized protein BXZ73DRAFT_103015 [Epithele typhae]KAH9926334.1 hypothetical protein BXZ73DRAFT_103015 [Epithele typhae]
MKYSLITLALALGASAAPGFKPSFTTRKRAAFTLQNGQDAIALNQKFAGLTADSACTAGENACVKDQFAQCVNGKFVLQSCGATLVCAALPLVNSAGTSITCTTAADRDARIAATGATAASTGAATTSAAAAASSSVAAGNNAANGNAASSAAPPAGTAAANAQTALTIDPSNVFDYSTTGEPLNDGQEASTTSTNNFINFCLQFPQKQKTNGKQIVEGSCNQTPMGVIAAKALMPAAAFVEPANLATVPANQNFTIKIAIQNIETGHFTNPDTTFHMAPQTVNDAGLIKGHSHVTIQQIESLTSTKIVDATSFQFFKGLNGVAQNGILSTVVGGGLKPGVYRIGTINSSSNHQPALVAVAQRGILDAVAYFTVQ